ncbi:MAG TPA: hypothetical protein EYP14_12835, partial [Planctomycetaceae bacterium]|nr:hypothetical protein [Planctomycetaceae bacterium]
MIGAILLQSAGQLATGATWRLLRMALNAATELFAEGRESLRTHKPSRSDDGDDVASVTTSLMHSELLWLYSLLFSDFVGAARVSREAKRVLNWRLRDSTDEDGSPRAVLVEDIAGWMAPLVRATVWAERFGVPLWDEPARRRFRALVRVVTAMCLPDGQIALSSGPAHKTLSLLQAATRLAGISGRAHPQRYLRQIGEDPACRGRSEGRAATPTRPADGWPGSQS